MNLLKFEQSRHFPSHLHLNSWRFPTTSTLIAISMYIKHSQRPNLVFVPFFSMQKKVTKKTKFLTRCNLNNKVSSLAGHDENFNNFKYYIDPFLSAPRLEKARKQDDDIFENGFFSKGIMTAEAKMLQQLHWQPQGKI